MPRRPRISLAGFPVHVVQRGNNRTACFFVDADRRAYLRWLKQYAEELRVGIHAWVLMTNHVHLLMTPRAPHALSSLMQNLGRRYVRYFNQRLGRSGTLWEGRFRACPVHADGYLLACMRYIESNPVRAGLASGPGEYRWSSFRANAHGMPDSLTSAHAVYSALGSTHMERQARYREIFRERSADGIPAQIRRSTRSGQLLASAEVIARMEAVHGVRLGAGRRGRRPRSSPAAAAIGP